VLDGPIGGGSLGAMFIVLSPRGGRDVLVLVLVLYDSLGHGWWRHGGGRCSEGPGLAAQKRNCNQGKERERGQSPGRKRQRDRARRFECAETPRRGAASLNERDPAPSDRPGAPLCPDPRPRVKRKREKNAESTLARNENQNERGNPFRCWCATTRRAAAEQQGFGGTHPLLPPHPPTSSSSHQPPPPGKRLSPTYVSSHSSGFGATPQKKIKKKSKRPWI